MTAPLKIAIAGTGYVGLSNAVLLAQHNEVVALDIVAAKVEQINRGQSPIHDDDIQRYLSTGALNLRATTNAHSEHSSAASTNTAPRYSPYPAATGGATFAW